MNEEDVLNEVAPATSTLLLDAAREAMPVFQDEMKSDCLVYHVDFWISSLEAHELVAGGFPKRKVDLVLTDPSYSLKTKRSMYSSLHDIIRPENMSMSEECGGQ